ncbi:hypothetical protein NDU88_002862 [Pleurodeles waltl]|uniref:Uncharacterized protein n=1 Tax=Pleurodeles waltl TaxID=8319 RepID=A0AAV7MNW2_PLEWA|nr:hypothetical protein NDU88_002862 [Pleurodeles waltl]
MKQDGHLERELRDAGIRGAQGQPENPPHPAPLTPATAVPQTCALGLRKSGSEGQNLAARSWPRRPGWRGGVASSEGRSWGAHGGCEAAWRAAGVVTTHACLFILFNLTYGPPAPSGRSIKVAQTLRQPRREQELCWRGGTVPLEHRTEQSTQQKHTIGSRGATPLLSSDAEGQ